MTDAKNLLDQALKQNILLLEADLEPVDGAGARFQPTGFPDLGPALYERPREDGSTVRCLLVESEASMANHLENLLWDHVRNKPREPADTLPYVEVVDAGGNFLTSSRIEPHRLASAYIMDGRVRGSNIMDGRVRGSNQKGLDAVLQALGLRPQQAGTAQPLPWPQIYEGVLRLDPLCLLHGVFFSRGEFPHNPKVPRALRAYIEAEGVREVNYGGTKKDLVMPGTAREQGRSAEAGAEAGYGYIPYARQEFTAEAIRARFLLDVGAIRGYGLGAKVDRLLAGLGLYEVLAFLSQQPIHLRTNCRLLARRLRTRLPAHGVGLPEEPEALAKTSEGLANHLQTLAQEVRREKGLPEPPSLTVEWQRRREQAEEEEAEEEEEG